MSRLLVEAAFKTGVSIAVRTEIAELAGGIWEALLTTVAGLAVAIPAFLAYRYLEGRIDKTAETLQEYGLQLLEQVFPTAAETTTKGAAEGDK